MDTDFQDRIDDLFSRAVKLPASEWHSFLSEACNGDTNVLAEVEKLLEAHDRLERSPNVLATQIADNQVENEQTDPLIGQLIGPYVVERRLGSGGFGDVFLATRAKEYRQLVAIKVVRRDVRNLPRFEVERQLLADLQHEHIARLFDGGTLPDGRPYIIMEYINGLQLTEYCDENRLTIAQRLALFRQVCSAISYAHHYSVLHRDIKPGNILVTGKRLPFVKLLDFGIAKMLDGDAHRRLMSRRKVPITFTPLIPPDSETVSFAYDNSAHEVTSTSLTRGGPMTPAYASPEQVEGRELSTASDVYSLGVVLYEVLAGRRPYTFRDGSFLEIQYIVCHQEPSRPSAPFAPPGHGADVSGVVHAETLEIAQLRRSKPDKLYKDLRGDLEEIILMALRKDPLRRYQTADALLDDLDRYERGFPVVARPASTPERISRWCKRNPWLAASAVLGLAIVLFLLLAGPGMAARERYLRTAATQALHEAESAQNEQQRLADMYRKAAEQADASRKEITEQICRLTCMQGQSDIDNGNRKLGILRLAKAVEFVEQANDKSLTAFVRACFSAAWRQDDAVKIESGHSLAAIAYCSDATRMMVGTESGKVIEINVDTKVQRNVYSGNDEIRCIGYSLDDRSVWFATRSGKVRNISVEDVDTLTEAIEISEPLSISMDDDGQLVYVLSENGTLSAIQSSNRQVVASVAKSKPRPGRMNLRIPTEDEVHIDVNGYSYQLAIKGNDLVLTSSSNMWPVGPSRPIISGGRIEAGNRIAVRLEDGQYRLFRQPSEMPTIPADPQLFIESRSKWEFRQFENQERLGHQAHIAKGVSKPIPSNEVRYGLPIAASCIGVTYGPETRVQLVWLPNGDTVSEFKENHTKLIAIPRNVPAIAIGDSRGDIHIYRVQTIEKASPRQIMLACQIKECYALADDKIEDAFAKRHSLKRGITFQQTEPDTRPSIRGLQKLDEWQIRDMKDELDSLGGMPAELN